MSQHYLEGITPNGNVTILVGWDRPLSYFFMVIESQQLDEPLYSNLYEVDPASLTLEYFQQVLERFNIKNISLQPEHQSGLYEQLIKDRERNI
ncbi:hypothetical protein ACQ69I_003293 [Yersinia enterocolitica]|uniref:hypothetical protein n=1 Tax=Yersinia TaxID=629 RepID=UPI0005E37554|nr:MULTISPECIES: hypothetical protein [Yersinia]MCW6576455.1 hypothetical protein [Yersinia ruckeri]CQH79366.1 Uncharacterised protein [Yersinia enterocolitica]